METNAIKRMRPCIIYGHRVAERPEGKFGPDAGNFVSTAEFERLLAHIADNRPDGDWADRLARHDTGTRPFVLLTFDDGYADLYTVVLPLLERYRVPCVIFITTGFVDRELGNYESMLASAIAASRELTCPRHGRIALADAAARADAYERIRLLLKPRSRRARDAYLDELFRLNPTVGKKRTCDFLDWTQIRELDRHPLVTIGAHSRSHILLSRPNPLEVHAELTHSRRRLETELGRAVDLVAYPYGAHNAMTRFLARRAGYRLGFSTRPDTLEVSYRPMSIPRIDIHDYLTGVPGCSNA